MKMFALTAICTFALAGYALAEEVMGIVVKVEGNSVTYYKLKFVKGGGKQGIGKFDKDGDAITATVTSSVKVAKGIYSYEEKKWSAGDPIEGGLDAAIFKNINQKKGQSAHIYVVDDGADKGKITQILIGGPAKKKGG